MPLEMRSHWLDLPKHLLISGKYEKLNKLLTHLSFIEIKIRERNVFELLTDYLLCYNKPEFPTTRIDKYYNFIRSNTYILDSNPELTLQQAANQSFKSPVSKNSQEEIENRKGVKWIQRISHSTFLNKTLQIKIQNEIISCSDYITQRGLLAVGTKTGFLFIIEIISGRQLQRAKISDFPITKCRFTSDSTKILIGFTNGMLVYFDIEKGGALNMWNIHRGGISSLTPNKSKNLFISTGEKGKVIIWEIDQSFRITYSIIYEAKLHEEPLPALASAFLHFDKVIIIGLADGRILFFFNDTRKWNKFRSASGSYRAITHLATTPSGDSFWSVSMDGKINRFKIDRNFSLDVHQFFSIGSSINSIYLPENDIGYVSTRGGTTIKLNLIDWEQNLEYGGKSPTVDNYLINSQEEMLAILENGDIFSHSLANKETRETHRKDWVIKDVFWVLNSYILVIWGENHPNGFFFVTNEIFDLDIQLYEPKKFQLIRERTLKSKIGIGNIIHKSRYLVSTFDDLESKIHGFVVYDILSDRKIKKVFTEGRIRDMVSDDRGDLILVYEDNKQLSKWKFMEWELEWKIPVEPKAGNLWIDFDRNLFGWTPTHKYWLDTGKNFREEMAANCSLEKYFKGRIFRVEYNSVFLYQNAGDKEKIFHSKGLNIDWLHPLDFDTAFVAINDGSLFLVSRIEQKQDLISQEIHKKFQPIVKGDLLIFITSEFWIKVFSLKEMKIISQLPVEVPIKSFKINEEGNLLAIVSTFDELYTYKLNLT